jgi:transglutaminase-like putative cysteine protease
MYYSIRHLTKFLYKSPVSESIMELRMHPRSDQSQRCLTFHLSVSPRCRIFNFRDHLGNHVHHFDIPVQHEQLVIVAESLVEIQPTAEIPGALGPGSWEELDRLVLEALGDYFDLRRRDDPLSVLHKLNKQLYDYFDYKPKSTKADSPIDLALSTRAGVCQDFAHIMITLVRTRLKIPCRYVSGYLYHAASGKDRSESAATHAWVEAFLPERGWVGFDPTNWLVATDRHIRTAIGRDYTDVPPTHGIFRGRTKSELTVAVRVTPSEGTLSLDEELPVPEDWSILVEKAQAIPSPPPAQKRSHHQAQQQ